ncbi:Copia protein [Araneus ventricosus]|uniref:Copia protein n=1 Tax=Araneus ventricosus TaxID=182803 RepID=A0A4Y2DJ07_ARAVE|nr:Copia protein [Araneus ventricosus]
MDKLEYQAIEKLDASNYNSWCDDVRVILLEKDCWDIVQGTETSPAEGATAKEVGDYRLRKSRAYSIIYLNTEKTHRPLISDTEDARQAWEKLKQHFRPESRARAVALTDTFFSCKIQEGETIGLYAARLRQLLNQLKDAGAPIAEWYQSFQVIHYLPMEFSGIVQSIYRWEDKKFIFDNVVTELLAEESRLKQCQSDLDFIALDIDDLEVWHRKYCHVNPHYIVNTSNNDSVRELPNLKSKAIVCEPCRLAKSKRRSFKPIDDYSRKVTTFPMKRKTEVFSCFTKYQKRAERFTNSKIVNIRTDNGMEFCYTEFNKFLEDQGIHAERTNVYSPEQNGVSERFNYTAMDAVKAMLKDSGLGNGFWVEALLCFSYVWNRVCHKRQKKTPFELFGGRKPSVKHFKIFGTTAYVRVPRKTRSKLQMRSKQSRPEQKRGPVKS